MDTNDVTNWLPIFRISLNILLPILGYWFFFKKTHVKRIWSLIPLVREYKFAQVAGAEEYGKIYCISSFLAYTSLVFYDIAGSVTAIDRTTVYILFILVMVFAITNIVYQIRIISSLCELWGKKKIWILPWVISSRLSMLFWGISKRFTPVEISNISSNSSLAASDSGYVAKDTKEGLTINIKERSVTNNTKKKVLLKDIHMNIKPGTMVLLLGGSGAGKTTLINAINGYEKADAEIILNGKDVYKHFDDMKYEIGFVPQQDLIRYNDTVYRTLMDSATLRLPTNVKRAQKIERVNEVMDIFGLTPVKNNIVGKQSGGQKKRISIAMEFISNPSLFILDEPDSGLDGILAKELMKRLHEISREGKIVIVITHSPDRVIDLFDEVIVLAKDENRTGRLVFHGPVDEARSFFERDTMEDIVKTINRIEEGGDGRADELIEKYTEVLNGR